MLCTATGIAKRFGHFVTIVDHNKERAIRGGSAQFAVGIK
jgi:hypothetical protein